jgi:hypothetical protein
VHLNRVNAVMRRVLLCTSLFSSSLLGVLCDVGSLEPVISLLRVPPFSLGGAEILMLPTDIPQLILFVPYYEASASIHSSVVVLVYLSSFFFHLLIFTMLHLQKDSWHGQCAFIRSVPVLFASTRPTGAYASWLGFMPSQVQLLLFLGILRTGRTVPAYHLRGPRKNLASAVGSNAFLGVFFSSFVSSVHLSVVGLRWFRRFL